jgi:ADP-heptose:LPS heptosyltransferase
MCTQAEMIIANDTGPSHIAALSNTPLFWIAIDNQITRSCMPIGENVYPILSSNIKSLNTNIIIKKIEEIFS